MSLYKYVPHPHILKRREQGPIQLDDISETLNEKLARQGTKLFGSMPAFYLFVVYGALGAIFTAQQATLLYWSNWIQLWSLPLLMVGGIVLGKVADKRAVQTFKDAEAMLAEQQKLQEHMSAQDEEIAALKQLLLVLVAQPPAGGAAK